MNLQESIRKILREETEYGGGIFYHNSDYDIESFKPQLRNRKKNSYLFFSNEPNTFIDRKYTYEVKLKFNPNKIFNTFKHINDYGIKYTLEEFTSYTFFFLELFFKSIYRFPSLLIDFSLSILIIEIIFFLIYINCLHSVQAIFIIFFLINLNILSLLSGFFGLEVVLKSSS